MRLKKPARRQKLQATTTSHLAASPLLSPVECSCDLVCLSGLWLLPHQGHLPQSFRKDSAARLLLRNASPRFVMKTFYLKQMCHGADTAQIGADQQQQKGTRHKKAIWAFYLRHLVSLPPLCFCHSRSSPRFHTVSLATDLEARSSDHGRAPSGREYSRHNTSTWGEMERKKKKYTICEDL